MEQQVRRMFDNLKELAVSEVTTKSNLAAALQGFERAIEANPKDELARAQAAAYRGALAVQRERVHHLSEAVRFLQLFATIPEPVVVA